MERKKIAILGSTGSIGQSALAVVDHLGLQITTLAASGAHLDLLEAQVFRYNPSLVAVFHQKSAEELRKRVPFVRIVSGLEGLCLAAAYEENDLVVAAISGSIGIQPVLRAIEAEIDVALANKEVLVAAGALVMQKAKEKKVNILPLDSEHSAIFQCLEGKPIDSVHRLILTASGGPFFHNPPQRGDTVSLEEALLHPTWRMGPKITIDSSTLMNKGLEVIEAHFLFDIPLEKISVVVHPQSIIHSMVEFIDGSILAQLSSPDMKAPIQCALTYPQREKGLLAPFDLLQYHKLEFYPPDLTKFRCLALAYEALKKGKSAPCFLNAANEILVDRFIKKRDRMV